MTIRDPFPLETSNFLTWLQQHGCSLSSKIKLDDLRYRSGGRGVVATTDIEPDEDLFSIPRTAIFTPVTSSMPSKYLEGLDDEPWLALILTMVYEERQGFKSSWCSYFAVLPSSFDTLMFWSTTELDLLRGSAVLDKIGKTKAEQSFATKLLPVINANKDEFFTNFLNEQQVVNMCHRMASIIMAYAFDVEQASQSDDSNSNSSSGGEDNWAEDDGSDERPPQVGLIPMADMLNADAERNNAKLFYMDDKVVMRSIKNIKQGEEIFNDYGPLPRADLLRRYGYITDEYAKYDVVELDIALVVEQAVKTLGISHEDAQRRVSYLEDLGLPTDAFDVAYDSAEDGQFPIELIALLNTLTLSKVDFDKAAAKQSRPSRSLSADRPQSLQLLRSVLERRRAQYSEPRQKQELDTISARRFEMAAQVIAGETSVLEDAIQHVDEMLKPATNKRAAQHGDHNSNTSKKLKR